MFIFFTYRVGSFWSAGDLWRPHAVSSGFSRVPGCRVHGGHLWGRTGGPTSVGAPRTHRDHLWVPRPLWEPPEAPQTPVGLTCGPPDIRGPTVETPLWPTVTRRDHLVDHGAWWEPPTGLQTLFEKWCWATVGL
ncbi:hypothetical protein FKM82_020415 [Ascaphus truei]